MLFKILKKKLILFIIVLIAFLIGGLAIRNMSILQKNVKVVDSALLTSEFKRISELATYKYSYSDIIIFKDATKFQGITLPLTQKSFIVKFKGVVKAGSDLKNAEISINSKENSVLVKIGKAKILDNVVDTNNTTILEEKSALFNKLDSQEIIKELNGKKKEIEEQLIKEGFLNDANESTKALIEGLLKSAGFNTINIVFQ